MSKLLESVVYVAPLLNKAYLYDCTISITNKEEYIAYYPGEKLDIKIKVGSSLRDGGINATVIKTGKRVVRSVSSEVYGVPYIAVGYPLVENNQVVGCISTCVPTDREELIIEIANKLSSVTNDIVTNTELLANSSIELEFTSQEVNNSTQIVKKKVEESSKFSDLIKNISTQSNILGLNASIEAARAGRHGNGFSIVAKEIRKLSESTSQSATNISSHLLEVNELINKVSEEMENTKNFTVDQSAGIQELSSVTNRLQEMIEELRTLANSYKAQ